MIDKNRVKLYLVPERYIWSMFAAKVVPGGYISIPQGIGLPDGAVVMWVQFNHARRAFSICVCHESFDVVDECNEIPIACDLAAVEMAVFKIAEEQ